ncbi:MAG TPA: hypothetical protein VL358_03610 [Caulobacteraceae bacterium]|jgi:hypothetical protein|nr:hypothetical protein [Caulobacteraceae bacterium]
MSSSSLVTDIPHAVAAPPRTAPPVSRLLQAFVLIGLLAVAAPAILVRMPPLLDLPNHYARIWMLAGGLKNGPLSHMYAVDWSSAWTNIGVDLLAQILGMAIPGQALGPLFLAAALVLPPIGAVVLHQRLYNGWRWWQVVLPITAFATTLLAGFLNYQIGLGLAMLAAAADPWLQRRATPVQVVLARVAIAVALLVVHIFALGFYAALLGGMALGPRLALVFNRQGLRDTALKLLGVAAAVAIPLLAYRLTASHVPGETGSETIWGPTTLAYKFDVLGCAFGTYDNWIDGLFFGSLAAICGYALVRGRLRVHQGLALAALALAVVALLMPTWAAETGWIDQRVPIMALLTLMAAVHPDVADTKAARMAMATAMLALVLGRAAWIGGIWFERQADADAIERALSHVPAGAAVLPLDHRPSIRGMARAPVGRYFHLGASYYHDYTLSVMQRGAFSPLIFTMQGKQPLRVRAPWNEISVPNGGRSPTLGVLRKPTRGWLIVAPYIRHWRERFDYALMLNADVLESVDKEVLPEGMTLVANEGFARLYRIDRLRPAPPEEAEPDQNLIRAAAPRTKSLRIRTPKV